MKSILEKLFAELKQAALNQAWNEVAEAMQKAESKIKKLKVKPKSDKLSDVLKAEIKTLISESIVDQLRKKGAL